MDHITEIRFQSHCDFLKKNIAENPAESFEKVISSTSLQKIFNEEAGQFRQRIFFPMETLWTFISQVLSPDGSCREALARYIGSRVQRGKSACSYYTGAYCRGRARLPLSLIQKLAFYIGEQTLKHVEKSWNWKGKNVKLVDGSSLSGRFQLS